MVPEADEPTRLGVEQTPKVIAPEARPPATTALAAWWLVVVAATGALVLLALNRLRWSMVALAIALWIGAAVRAAASKEQAGGLVVRSRAFDVLVLLVLGTAVLVAGLALRRT